MDGLPDELMEEVLGKLEENEDKLSAALTCRRFLTAIHKKLPLATAICVQFSGNHSECGASVKVYCKRRNEYLGAVLTVCQCESNGCTQMMHLVLPRLSKDVSSLSLEDELIGERLSDSAAHAILDGCSSAPLSSISFEHVDFSAVRPWTLALIASFHRLQEVHLLSCILPDGLLLRALAASMQTLRCLSVTDSSLVSDKLCSALARGAPCLEEISIRGCHGVTAASLVPLLEAAGRRRGQQLTVRMEETGFNAEHLERCMRSSLMPSGKEWAVTRMRMELGYATPVLLLTHPSGKAILVYD
ncbi:hypothetical protein PENTCL1PPCAC_13330 [Pristionchus entomophagus]|uniref:F-box domain-containing protein n=1 Tax=Pristionchus entomophagus TaxID=358040 RepID=A0AAV5TEM0_9BILA|nr:hypothetical protein PENTCL1PPCAC_13330 [Pristionchus entomophagus]